MPSILVVTSSSVQRRTLTCILERGGYSVAVAAHPARARKLLASWSADLVLVDAASEDDDNHALLNEFRAAQLPFIALSNSAHARDRRRSLDLGASLVLELPCSSPELLHAVEQLVGRLHPLVLTLSAHLASESIEDWQAA